MVAPALLAAGLGGLTISAGSNLYAQKFSRALYRRQINAYSQLEKGYARHLAKHGRRLNPYRAYERYGRHIDNSRTSLGNSYIGSVGSTAGTVGAGLMMAGKTRKWL